MPVVRNLQRILAVTYLESPTPSDAVGFIVGFVLLIAIIRFLILPFVLDQIKKWRGK